MFAVVVVPAMTLLHVKPKDVQFRWRLQRRDLINLCAAGTTESYKQAQQRNLAGKLASSTGSVITVGL